MVGPRLRECCRQVEAEAVSNSRNNIHQTWGPSYTGAQYMAEKYGIIYGWNGIRWIAAFMSMRFSFSESMFTRYDNWRDITTRGQ